MGFRVQGSGLRAQRVGVIGLGLGFVEAVRVTPEVGRVRVVHGPHDSVEAGGRGGLLLPSRAAGVPLVRRTLMCH